MSNKEIIHDEYCPGRCPKCDSDNVKYFGSEPDGEQSHIVKIVN